MTAGFTEPLTKQVALTGVETDLGSLFGESTGKVRLSIPDAATSSVWLGKKGVTTDDDEYKKGTQTQLPTTSLRGWYAVTDGASVTITITIATGGVDAPDWITAGTNGASSGGGGGGGTVDQGAGDAANPWFVQGVNGGVPERLATQADQTNGEQKTRITDGTNDAVVMNSAPTGTEYGIGTRAIGTTATTNSINSQVDGHSETIGATTDADTGSTVVALLKRLKGLFAGGLPSALIADRLPVIIGSWLGSTAPTVGAKTKASSIPVAIATETIGTAGTPSADVFSMQGVPSGTPMPASNAVASQADGHSATLGTTADATTATTVIGRLQKLVSLLPAALGLGGGLKSEGVGVAGTPAGGVASVQGVSGGTAIPVSGTVAATQSGTWSTGVANWIGSTSPTVGQKTGANSIPVVLASDTAAFTFQPSSSPNVANYLPVRVNVDGANYWSVMANSAGVNAPGNSPVIWSMMRGRTYSAAATPGLVYDIQVDTTGRVAVFGNRVARTAQIGRAHV